MQRPQITNRSDRVAAEHGDDGDTLADALRRIAALRSMIHPGSPGDEATGAAAPELRGRFDCLDEMPPSPETNAATADAPEAPHAPVDEKPGPEGIDAIVDESAMSEPETVPAESDDHWFPGMDAAAPDSSNTDISRATTTGDDELSSEDHAEDENGFWFPAMDAEVGETLAAEPAPPPSMPDAVQAPGAPRDRPQPLLSADELSVLLEMPADEDSHELDDKWSDDPTWGETFWHQVDAYLQSVEGADVVHAAPTAHEDVGDVIEFREPQSEPVQDTHFWRPGDETDLALDGDATGLFLIGGETPGVVLIEDGVMHAMRTGRGTRVGEVVVSWSDSPWTDVDGMGWTRVATLSGMSDLRVEQTPAHDRAVVICGELSGTALKADRVRLVESTDDGQIEFPVRQIGGFADALSCDWPFDGLLEDEASYRLLV